MNTTDLPLVTIVIMNWNGKHFLKTCLDSICVQDYSNIETLVVDCASTDGSVGYLRQEYPQVRVLALEEDPGPAQANNLGCQAARGQYVMLLNNDVILPTDTVRRMAEALADGEDCVVNAVELDWDGHFVDAGKMHFWSRPLYHLFRLKGQTAFYPSTACCLAPKRVYLDNPLNAHLFIYEDTEWGWRLQLRGIRLKVLLDICFHHKVAGTLGISPRQAFMRAYTAAATHFICFRLPTLALYSPLLVYSYLRQSIGFVLRGKPGLIVHFLRGVLEFCRRIKVLNADRKRVQRERLVSDRKILRIMIGSVGFSKGARKKWEKQQARAGGSSNP